MIEINLLPHRQARRVADLRESIAVLALGLICLVGGIYFAKNHVANEQARVENVVRQLNADIKRYKPQEKKVKQFRKKREQLEDKLAVIEGLDQARSGPVRIMDELSRSTPERLWLKKLETSKGRISLEGVSTDTGVVADFLRTLNGSEWFHNVDLDRTSGGDTVKGVRLVNFEVTAQIRKARKKKKKKAEGEAAQAAASTSGKS